MNSTEPRYAPPGSLSVPALVAATGARLLAGPESGTWNLCTDSRQMGDGTVFVALVGELHDGHGFVEPVLADFQAGALVERGRVGKDLVLPQRIDGPVLEVEDTLVAFGAAARAFLEQHRPTVAAITGSVGKTPTRALLGPGRTNLWNTHIFIFR